MNPRLSFSLLALSGLLAAAPSGFAQLTSPEVHPDRSVTFRLRAPNAQRVTVSGDFWGRKSFPMALDPAQSNVWTVTTPPLEPDIYAYTFNMDGATMVDPQNTFVRVGAWAYMSQVYVPGFAYVAAFSSAIRGNVSTNYSAFLADPARANKNYKLVWIGCGERDGLMEGNRNFQALLKEKGIKHEWVSSPDYAHEWTLWRRYLHEVLQKLFKE